LEHFKADYDNNAFISSHCWIVIKDFKKWKDSFALWQELEESKKGKCNGNASMDGVMNLDDKGECLGNAASNGLASTGRIHWPLGHKASKAYIARQDGSLAFQDTFWELMVKKEEASVERGESRRGDKEATTKSFVDLQERSVAAGEAIAKA
jgi:hypothetical protein